MVSGDESGSESEDDECVVSVFCFRKLSVFASWKVGSVGDPQPSKSDLGNWRALSSASASIRAFGFGFHPLSTLIVDSKAESGKKVDFSGQS